MSVSALTTYSEENLLRLAKRVNNPKRSYLLVNPLQGKHIPVPPSEAIDMMQHLGKTVREAHGGCPLVIGFSETATAIGAAVALEINNRCVYLQTTREQDDRVNKWVYFSEEHSHATEQKLCGDDLEGRITNSDYILLIDDEISTGKTILNIVKAIRKACPTAEDKEFVVASPINRVDRNVLLEFADQGITFVSLLKLDPEDYEDKVKNFPVHEAEAFSLDRNEDSGPEISAISAAIPPARRGIVIEEYVKACQTANEAILHKVNISKDEDVLILGTEEFMFPALQLGCQIQKLSAVRSVRFHATTRSPIGISTSKGYPIKNGIRIHSMYDKDRITYLYNLAHYDTVIVYSDSPNVVPEAVLDLQRGLKERHCSKVHFFYSGNHV